MKKFWIVTTNPTAGSMNQTYDEAVIKAKKKAAEGYDSVYIMEATAGVVMPVPAFEIQTLN